VKFEERTRAADGAVTGIARHAFTGSPGRRAA
jgi:hypothetical protein